MKTTQILAMTVAMALMPLAAAGPVDDLVALPALEPPVLGNAETGNYLVGFHNLPAERTSYAGFPVVDVNEGINYLLVKADEPARLHAHALTDPEVRYVEAESMDWFLDFVPNDYFYNHAAHWGSKRIGGEAAWDVTMGTTAIKVAHIDSGLNKGHEDIDRYLQGYDFYNGDNNPDDSSGCNYHGTHTTSTAGATINNGLGIAGMSQHTVLPIKIFHYSNPFIGCGTTTSAITGALQYAGDQGSHLSSNSWGGGGYSSAIDDAITYAHNLGTIHVASAGNSGPCSNCVGEPWYSSGDRAIVVSSLTDGDTFSSFSSRGSQVDIIAPGDYIAGAEAGTNTYVAMSGTSMAAPHVTGALALYMAATGTTDYASVTAALASTAEDLGLSSDRQGAGLVRADLLVAGGNPPPPPPAPQCDDGIDNDGDGLTDMADPGCSSPTDDDESDDPPTGGITLTASGYKVKGKHHADLSWSGAAGSNVDVFVDGGLWTTTANDGFYTWTNGAKGGAVYTFQVCEAGTSTCSNIDTVVF